MIAGELRKGTESKINTVTQVSCAIFKPFVSQPGLKCSQNSIITAKV
jgi:hypothetical protein